MCLICTISGDLNQKGPLGKYQLDGLGILALIPSLPLLALIYLHRKVLSRVTFPTCKFTPTCSRYALDAIKRYGTFRGFYLACWRVLRCNPIHPGGYDPLV